MSDYGSKFQYGGVVYPITSSTINTLLQDADPSLFHTIHFAASVLTTYVQPRLLAEVARVPRITAIASAVAMLLPWDPVPYLNETQIQFPLLAIYRKREKFSWHTQSYYHDVSEWGVQYVLPPITAGQTERVRPILYSVARTLLDRFENKMDDGYLNGADVWATAGLEQINFTEVEYGEYEGAKSNMFFPTMKGTLIVKESQRPLGTAQFQFFNGLDNAADVVPSDGTATLPDVVDSQNTFIDPNAPKPTFSAYADVTNSFSTLFPTPTGTISADTDTVTGQAIERYTTGASRTATAGVFDFASQGPVSFVLVWRQTLYASTGDHVLFDTTNNGTTRGVQIIARDNYPTSTAGRQIIGRVFDGSTWIVDYTTHGPVGGYQALLWSVAVITITATSLSIYVDGLNWITITFAPITFPSGAALAAKIGNGPFDFLAFEAWQGGLTVPNALVTTARLQTRFVLPYKPVLLWTDTNWGESDPAACTLSDNTYVAITTKYPGPGSNIGHIESRTSTDGITWTPTPGDGSTSGLTLPFTAPTGGGVFDASVTQLSNGTVVAVANLTDLTTVHTLKAANPAAVRSNIWTNETALTPGTAALELNTSDLTEDPAHAGTVYALTYSGALNGPWSVMQYKSTDYCTTWGTPVKVLDGVALSMNFAEPGLKFVTAAAATKYPDLPTTGGFFYLVRNETTSSMDEVTSATGLAGSFTRRTTNLAVHSAARFRFLADGTLVFLGRDNSTNYNTIYRRTGVSGGVAQYTANPVAPSIIPTFGDVVGGNNIGQYGNICREVVTGLPLVVTANRLGLALCSVYARLWPEWQIFGQMPIIVSPSSVPTKNALDTVQFAARGAGGYVWSLATNATGGSIGSSTGLYTAGNAGGTDIVRCTDQNGYFDATKDVSILVNAGVGALPDTANILFDIDASATARVHVTGSSVNSVDNPTGAGSAAVGATGHKPVYGTSTQNSLKTFDCTGAAILTVTLPGTGAVAFSDFTFASVIVTGASVAGVQAFGGHSSGGFVCRMDGGTLRAVDYQGGAIDHLFSDLVLTPNTAHVVVFRRTGTTIDAWLDGAKSASPGTLSSLAFQVLWPLNNDSDTTLFGEQFLGYKCEDVLWKVSESDGNVTAASSALKTKWGTT